MRGAFTRGQLSPASQPVAVGDVRPIRHGGKKKNEGMRRRREKNELTKTVRQEKTREENI